MIAAINISDGVLQWFRLILGRPEDLDDFLWRSGRNYHGISRRSLKVGLILSPYSSYGKVVKCQPEGLLRMCRNFRHYSTVTIFLSRQNI